MLKAITSCLRSQVAEIEGWYEEGRAECFDDDALGRLTLRYYQKLCSCLESNLDWLQLFLPSELKGRLDTEQAEWLQFRKARFHSLNLLYGLLGPGTAPFDRLGLLNAQSKFVKQRALELEEFRKAYNQRRPKTLLSIIG